MSKLLTVAIQIMAKRLVILYAVGIAALSCSPALMAQEFRQSSVHVCLECWVVLQQMTGSLPFSPSIRQEAAFAKAGEKNVMLVFPTDLAESLSEMQASAQLRILRDLNRLSLGKVLLQKTTASNFALKFFYQKSLDQNLNPHLSFSNSAPTYELEKNDPQELWSFYTQDGKKTIVFLNEYQTPGRGLLSLGHELVHGFDSLSLAYVNKYQSEWSQLDSVVLEARALFIELQLYLQAKQAKLLPGDNEEFNRILGGADLRDFAQQDLQQRILRYAVDLLIGSPRQSNFEVLPFHSQGLFGWSYQAGRIALSPLVPPENLQTTEQVFDSIARYFNLEKPQHQYVSALIKYREVSSSLIDMQLGMQSRKDLQATLSRRSSSSVYEYMVAENVFSCLDCSANPNAETGYAIRIGPSPRINGGDRKHKIIEGSYPEQKFDEQFDRNLKKFSSGQHFSKKTFLQDGPALDLKEGKKEDKKEGKIKGNLQDE